MGFPFSNCLFNRCEWCNCSQWDLEGGNYIVKLYGKGKYDGHKMCLDCLRSKF